MSAETRLLAAVATEPAAQEPVPRAPAIPSALALDLLAAVLSAGVPVPAALDALADALGPDDGTGRAVRELALRLLSGDRRPDPGGSRDGRLGGGGRRGGRGWGGGRTWGGGRGPVSGRGRSGGCRGPGARRDQTATAPDGDERPPVVPALEGALELAARAGLPPADLIRAAARRERARDAAVRRAAIRRLEVLLVVPAGLCLLPAFVLIGVVPVVIALLSR